jgi:cold shock CspA family protein
VFVHFRSIEAEKGAFRSLEEGQLVSYELTTDDLGRRCATRVRAEAA